MTAIDEAKILIIATDGFEQSELEFPRDQLRAKGATVHVATPDGEAIRGWSGKDWGQQADADLKLGAALVAEYDAIVLPGGQMNPDILRMNAEAVSLVKGFHDEGKVVAAICHAPWLLIEAGIVKGKDVTSWPSVKTDLINAGGNWHDDEVVVHQGLITSRKPGDLEAFVSKIVEEIEEGRHERSAA